MKRKFNPDISTFEDFYDRLVAFIQRVEPCFSVREEKEYTSRLEGSTIVMEGKDRGEPSEYDKAVLKDIYDGLRNNSDIKTQSFKKYKDRHHSPILALLIASGVVVYYS